MTKWEYWFLYGESGFIPDRELKQLGLEGWELIVVTRSLGGTGATCYILKRPIVEETV